MSGEEENEDDNYVFDLENEKEVDNLRKINGDNDNRKSGNKGGFLSSLLGKSSSSTTASPVSSASTPILYDEEKIIVPSITTHHNLRRASAVPMTSYVAITTHVLPESINSPQQHSPLHQHQSPTPEIIIAHPKKSVAHSFAEQPVMPEPLQDRVNGNASNHGHVPGSPKQNQITSVATPSPSSPRKSLANQQLNGSPASSSGSRRTSFFGGVITGFGNAIRRASKAQNSDIPTIGDNTSSTTHDSSDNQHQDAAGATTAKATAGGKDPIWIEKFTIDGLPFYWNRRSKEVRFEKPEELKTDIEKGMETDDWTWLPHPTKVWQPARITKKQKSGEIICEIVKTGETVIVPASKTLSGKKIPLWPLKQSSLFIAEDDLVALDDPNEGLILHTLRARYKQDQIYTFVGASRTVLISLNPYKMIDIYTLDEMDAQKNRGPNKSPPPHVFAIANDALETVKFYNRSAAILISGESGAGKTEATKQCLGFLAECAGSSNRVERKILLANPILEAFGNAKTLRNNNSSRFGKWIEVRFDPGSREISGAQITPFLLERSRLVYQQKGERNYHVLYQLCASERIRKKHQIGDPTEFRYLNQSECYELDGVDDELELQRTISSMTELGLSREEQDWIFKITCGVLHLGNIDFVLKDEEKIAAAQNKKKSAAATSISEKEADESEATKRTPSLGSALTNGRKSEDTIDEINNSHSHPGCMIANNTRTAGKRFFVPKPVAPKPVEVDKEVEELDANGVPHSPKVGFTIDHVSGHVIANHSRVLIDRKESATSPRPSLDDEEESLFGDKVPKRRSHAPGTGKGSVEAAAECLGVHVEELVQVLCQRSITVRKETSVIPLTPEEARDGCDSLAMAIYGRLFSWIVERINVSVSSSINKGKFVGILDIFGFEIFEKNSFEQLCINFTNEKLQQHFNSTMFKEEEGLYIFENIRFNKVEFVDNQPVVDLVEGKPEGILLFLDDECKTPGGSDERFLNKIERCHVKHPNFVVDSKGKLQKMFGFEIKHYAGTVRYDAQGFVAANTDTLYSDMYSLCSRSSDRFTRKIFPALQENERLRLKTIGAHFRGQLTQLMDILKGTESRYIRCIKPNAKQQPNNFENHLTLEQLRYSGVFDAVQIRKKGFPFRLTHKQFACQYKCINDGYIYKKSNDDPKGLCEEIIGASPQNFRAVQIGKTRVLYRAEHQKILLLLRNLAVEKILPWLQARFRSCLARMMYKNMKDAQKSLQTVMESEPDIGALDDAIEEVTNILGNLGARVFPTMRPSNLKKAKTLREGLLKWRELESEFERLDYSQQPVEELYTDMVAVLKKADKLKDIPMTRFQERIVESLKEKAEAEKTRRSEQNNGSDVFKSQEREESRRTLTETGVKVSRASKITVDPAQLTGMKRNSSLEVSSKEAASESRRVSNLGQRSSKLGQRSPAEAAIEEDGLENIELNGDFVEVTINQTNEKREGSKASKIGHMSSPKTDDRDGEENDTADQLDDGENNEEDGDFAKKMEERARIAIDNVDREALLTVTKGSDAADYTSDRITRCNELLALPEAEFVSLELEAAKKYDDRKRIIHREIRVKDLFLDSSGSKFTPITSCPILRKPEKFAASDFTTIFFGKEKLANRMMKWQKTSMPASLVDFDVLLQQQKSKVKDEEKQLKRLSQNSFRLIRALMGDIKDDVTSISEDEPIKQIIAMGEDQPNIIPELYMQAIKQVTDCHSEGKEKGYELIGLLISALGIPEVIESWILMWLRQEFESDSQKLRKYMCALHVQQYTTDAITKKDVSTMRKEFYSRDNSRFSVLVGESTGPTPHGSGADNANDQVNN